MVSQGATPFWISLAGRFLPIPPNNIPTRITATSFPGFSPLLERILIADGQLNPQNLEANNDLPHGRGSKVWKCRCCEKDTKYTREVAKRITLTVWSMSVIRTNLYSKFSILYTCIRLENGWSCFWLAESIYVESFRFFLAVVWSEGCRQTKAGSRH